MFFSCVCICHNRFVDWLPAFKQYLWGLVLPVVLYQTGVGGGGTPETCWRGLPGDTGREVSHSRCDDLRTWELLSRDQPESPAESALPSTPGWGRTMMLSALCNLNTATLQCSQGPVNCQDSRWSWRCWSQQWPVLCLTSLHFWSARDYIYESSVKLSVCTKCHVIQLLRWQYWIHVTIWKYQNAFLISHLLLYGITAYFLSINWPFMRSHVSDILTFVVTWGLECSPKDTHSQMECFFKLVRLSNLFRGTHKILLTSEFPVEGVITWVSGVVGRPCPGSLSTPLHATPERTAQTW